LTLEDERATLVWDVIEAKRSIVILPTSSDPVAEESAMRVIKEGGDSPNKKRRKEETNDRVGSTSDLDPSHDKLHNTMVASEAGSTDATAERGESHDNFGFFNDDDEVMVAQRDADDAAVTVAASSSSTHHRPAASAMAPGPAPTKPLKGKNKELYRVQKVDERPRKQSDIKGKAMKEKAERVMKYVEQLGLMSTPAKGKGQDWPKFIPCMMFVDQKEPNTHGEQHGKSRGKTNIVLLTDPEAIDDFEEALTGAWGVDWGAVKNNNNLQYEVTFAHDKKSAYKALFEKGK